MTYCKTIYAITLLLFSSILYGNDMRTISYERYEFRFEPESRKAPLSTLVYDIPYFGACGIFPPLHIMNEYMLMGGSDGGMGPGAKWTPFKISKDEYIELVQSIQSLDPKALGDSARFTFAKFEFDNSFDHIKKWEDWIQTVCTKHRDSYHKKQDLE